jgi:hypothetical protein
MKQLLRNFLSELVCALPVGTLTDRRYHDKYQNRGFHVTPVHFYSPVPDTREFPADLFDRPSLMPGVDMNEERQINNAIELSKKYENEYLNFNQNGFGGVDGFMLYSMIRSRKPKRVIEIGSGSSTLVSLNALNKN